jgi:hypothetical protein
MRPERQGGGEAGRFARLVALKIGVVAALTLVLTLLALRSVGLL